MTEQTNTRSRARTGTLEALKRPDGTIAYRGRLRLHDGSKSPRLDVPAGYTEARARAWLAAEQRAEDADGQMSKAKEEGARKRAAAEHRPAPGETADAWHARFVLTRPANKAREGYRWGKYVSPAIGHLPMANIDADELENLRDTLDRYVAEGRIMPKTALHIWTCVTVAFREASRRGRLRELRVREDNPCRDIAPPKRGGSRKRGWIYPDEALAVFSCVDIPREWREAHAVACFLYLRPQELHELRWKDVDLIHGVVSISRAWDDDFMVVGPPKTDAGIRSVPVEANLLPLLKRMAEGRAAEEKVVPIVAREFPRLAKATRAHLALAGITRAELFETSRTREPVDFRTWRDSGITWKALQRTGLEEIKAHAGHDDVSTTLGYIKRVAGRHDGGAPFPPLPANLLLTACGPASGPGAVRKSIVSIGYIVPKVGLEGTKNAGVDAVSATYEGAQYTDSPAKYAESNSDGPGCGPPLGPLERALADALSKAVEAGRFDVVAQLARELEARRLAASPNVVPLPATKKAKRS